MKEERLGMNQRDLNNKRIMYKTNTGVVSHALSEKYADERGTGSRYISMIEYFLSTGRIPVNYLKNTSALVF